MALYPNSRDSDLSVSVWQLMALRSAKNDGLDVPGEAIDDALKYLRYSYASPMDREGKPRDAVSGFQLHPGDLQPILYDVRSGTVGNASLWAVRIAVSQRSIWWLFEHPPKESERFFFYGLYYYAQGMHQAGESTQSVQMNWSQRSFYQCRGLMERGLHEAVRSGMWGAAYATALSLLSMSVRYHYLPIYQQ